MVESPWLNSVGPDHFTLITVSLPLNYIFDEVSAFRGITRTHLQRLINLNLTFVAVLTYLL